MQVATLKYSDFRRLCLSTRDDKYIDNVRNSFNVEVNTLWGRRDWLFYQRIACASTIVGVLTIGLQTDDAWRRGLHQSQQSSGG